MPENLPHAIAFRSDRQKRPLPVGHFYHPELDALRFFAFLLVFLHHALPTDPALYLNSGIPIAATQLLTLVKKAGAYGVDLFFALSSYLITELLYREYRVRNTIDVRSFYIRRALRIWPLYFFFLTATVFIVPLLFPPENLSAKYALAFSVFLGNWACVLGGMPFSVASPLWSVSIEEQFYIAWPPLLLLCGIKRIVWIAAGLLIVACTTRLILAIAGAGETAVWCNTFARLDAIAFGALLSTFLRTRVLSRATRIGLCLVGFLIFLIVTRYFEQDGWTSLITYPAIGIGSVFIVAGVIARQASNLTRGPFALIVYLGRISYGLYVFHLLALALISTQLFVPIIGLRLNFERRMICAFLLTVALAAISYHLLEKPFLRLKRRFTHVRSGPQDQP